MKYLEIPLYTRVVCFSIANYASIIAILILTILIFTIPLKISAEERVPPLKKGMTYIEVVKLWGSPQDKIEKEIKRKDIWIYKNKSRVVFENGAVISVVNPEGMDVLSPENIALLKKVEEKELNPQGSITPVANQDVVDDILSEIMKDPSNSEPGDKGPGQMGVSPMAPNVQPNMINQVPPPESIN